jgi:hypothetical protein
MAKQVTFDFYGLQIVPKSSFLKDVKGVTKTIAVGDGLSDDRAKWGLFKACQTAGLPVKWDAIKAMKLTKQQTSGIMDVVIPKATAKRTENEAKRYDKALETVLGKNPKMAAMMNFFK